MVRRVPRQPLNVVQHDKRRQVDLPPGLALDRGDELFKLVHDPLPQRRQDGLDDDLVQLGIHDGRDRNLAVVGARGVRDLGDAEGVGARHLPRDLDDSGDGPEGDGVGN